MENKERIILICLECGKTFKAKIRGNAKFCNNKCGYVYRKRTGISKRGTQIKLNCSVCGKEFYENKSTSKIRKYCSKKCADAGRVPPIRNKNINIVENICKNCGKRFHKEFYRLAKFCNRECLREYQSKQWKELTCKVCNKKFRVRLSRLPQYYCSRKCFMKRGITTEKIIRKCNVCNQRIIAPYYKFKDYKLKDGTIKKGLSTCSKKCGIKLRTKKWRNRKCKSKR